MPSAKLRDCGLEQVRIRSPRPESPARVSLRAPQARPSRDQFAEAARGQRGLRGGAELAGRPRCRRRSPARSWPRRRSRRRGHQWCGRAGRSPIPAPAPARWRALRPWPPASPRSAGRAPRPRQSSAPTGSPAAHRGAASAITSVMNLWVPRSMPLAQATTGVAVARCGARAATASRKFCAGVAIRMMSAAAARAISPVTSTLASRRAPGNFGLARVAAISAARSGWRA